jgi:hypothetical protein
MTSVMEMLYNLYMGYRQGTITFVSKSVDGFYAQCLQWLLNKTADEPVLWTYETTFTKGGVKNLYNLHKWALEVPHAT